MAVTTFITDDKGRKISAIISMKKYEQLLNDSEDLEEIRAYDKAMKRKHEFIPLENALKEIESSRKKKK